MVTLPVRRLPFERERQAAIDPTLEWIVTNGLGGYASTPVPGGLTRRYHGLLVAALPPPNGRLVYVSTMRTHVVYGGRPLLIDDPDLATLADTDAGLLESFCLEGGLPVWRYAFEGLTLEKRVFMPHRRNTTCVLFRVVRSDRPVHVVCRPWLHVRPIEAATSAPGASFFAPVLDEGVVTIGVDGLPPLLMRAGVLQQIEDGDPLPPADVRLIEEHARGYDCDANLRVPCTLRLGFDDSGTASLLLSAGDAPAASDAPLDLLADELDRRRALLALAGRPSGVEAELVLAADQFLIVPVGHDSAAAAPDHAPAPPGAAGRTVIAGYHWFTDWGRDTMIGLEGLTLETGRHEEAAQILRLFARHVQDGLIPNMFPEGARSGLYHTADATLWFVHAIGRYLAHTGDRALVDDLLPVLEEIFGFHRRGTRFGIGVDPRDGLLRQGAEGYQLTWMDAKVDGWVVTPRRGKAVEINALWYNALCLMADWLDQTGRAEAAAAYRDEAARTRASFNVRFWNPATGWLFDVVDGERGDDAACRPNQILAVSLPHPVLDARYRQAVVDEVGRRLLTPVGLRSLDPSHPDYRSQYVGNLRERDASYHQGTVWAWLIGPYVDALIGLGRSEAARVRDLLLPIDQHLGTAGVGSISEIFDADMPHLPRGCIAQAWSVAEALRAFRALARLAAPA